ncbi:TPA: phage holin family protein [Candidatus Galligastranaerophilus faecipullorum]|nr:phage holin family protein [Candidatus Galligastranaerophilus faecipullorum]
MILLLRWILFALAIMFTAWLIPGIEVDGFKSALLVVVIMALINIFIKPLLVLITLPINLLTLGLFIFVINALLLLLLGRIAPGFEVDGFLSAFLGSVVISFLGALISSIELNV